MTCACTLRGNAYVRASMRASDERVSYPAAQRCLYMLPWGLKVWFEQNKQIPVGPIGPTQHPVDTICT